MATTADWLATLGSQLAVASGGIEVFREYSGLLDQLEAEPSLSQVEAIHAMAVSWQRHLASVARAVHSAQLSAMAAEAAQTMAWVSSHVTAVDELKKAVRAMEGGEAAAPAPTSAEAGIGAAMAAQHAASPKQVLDRALAGVHRALKAGESPLASLAGALSVTESSLLDGTALTTVRQLSLRWAMRCASMRTRL